MAMFIPVRQHVWKYTANTAPGVALELTFVVRTAGEPSAMASAVRAVIKEIDPGQPVDEVTTLRQIIARKVSARNFAMVLLSLFAGVAVVLSAAGIYGVMANAVSLRRQEIGIRMALGARTGDVLRCIVGRGLMLTVLGLGTGLTAAFVFTRFLKSFLHGISPTDPWTFASLTVFLATVALVACWLPARRAAKVDPAVELRAGT